MPLVSSKLQQDQFGKIPATIFLRQSHLSFRFVIGREKDMTNSEILRLIQQSLQMDQERNEMSRALQHHHETYNDRHLNDDGFSNLELNDHDEPESLNDPPLPHIDEKTYDVISMMDASLFERIFPLSILQQMWSTDQTERKEGEGDHHHHDTQFEILKQRYESLEKTLSTVEKEKQYYQVRFEVFFLKNFD